MGLNDFMVLELDSQVMILIPLSFIIGSFVFFRELRDEYPEEQLLGFPLLIALSAAATYPFWGVMGSVLAGVIVGVIVSRHYGFRLWDIFDGLVTAVLWVIAIGCLRTAFVSLVAVASIFFGILVKRYYKRWGWYKSGRIGIIGLSESFIFILLFLVVAPMVVKRLYWVPFPVIEGFLVLVLFFLGVVIYRHSGRLLKEDLQWIKKVKKS